MSGLPVFATVVPLKFTVTPVMLFGCAFGSATARPSINPSLSCSSACSDSAPPLEIDDATTVRGFTRELRWNQAYYRLAQGL